MEKKENKKSKMSRRRFIGTTVAATSAFTVIPSHVVSAKRKKKKRPSDKLNIAGIGIGGIGFHNIKHMAEENIVALCDVDWKYANKAFDAFPNAVKYKDYRKMLDERKDIDAIVVGTPDHTHAIIAMAGIKRGLHTYVQKPLTHSVWESRKLTEAAKKYGVATQMGNQGNSDEGIRQMCEWIWSGKIGEIKEVHAWTDRPIWPQGLERPKETPPTPKTLDWDLFLGPAPKRPYHPSYTPWNWRAWWDFGTGALGDMACHILDPVFWALKLKYPTAVVGSSTQVNTESAPHAEYVVYTFHARDNLPKVAMPEVKVHWYDGGLLPERPAELTEGEPLGWNGGGCLFIGSKGKILCGCYGLKPTLLPRTEMAHFTQPEKTLRRIENAHGGGHEKDWIRACKESKEHRVEASSNFNLSGPLNEMVVMGTLAVRLQDLKRTLKWDGKKMEFTNISPTDEIRVVTSDKFDVIDGDPKFDTNYETMNASKVAKEWIRHTYREGWEQI